MEMPTVKVTREDWLRGAQRALAESGVSGVAVEPIAKQLGITRGSFYWHFKDREALLVGALELWESEETVGFIEELAPIEDPLVRLQTLFREALSGDKIAGLEPAIVAHASDPVVRVVLERVTTRRLAYLTELFAELNLDPEAARHQAVATYAAYLGWIELRRAAPDIAPETQRSGPLVAPALDHLLEMLTPGADAAGTSRR